MAQDEDLQVLRAIVRASAGEGSGEGSDYQGEKEQHPRNPTDGLVRGRIWVFDPDRVRAARFEQISTIEEFDFSYNSKVPAAQIRDLATLRFVEAGESVILHGPVGVGKTMIAQALGHQACRRGYSVAFTKTSRLLADLAGGHADRTWETRLRRWARPAVLITDDFAMRAFTPQQSDDLYELITERGAKSTIVTANRAASDWYELFPNPVVAESILDRLVNSAHHVAMQGRSYRPNTRPGVRRAEAKR